MARGVSSVPITCSYLMRLRSIQATSFFALVHTCWSLRRRRIWGKENPNPQAASWGLCHLPSPSSSSSGAPDKGISSGFNVQGDAPLPPRGHLVHGGCRKVPF